MLNRVGFFQLSRICKKGFAAERFEAATRAKRYGFESPWAGTTGLVDPRCRLASFFRTLDNHRMSSSREPAAVRLEERVAIVTGAGSGNGRGIALRFAEEGARIVAADVDVEAARQTADLVARAGGEAHALRADVSRRDEAAAMVEAAGERFGAVDILVNNAGVETLVPVLDLAESEWDRVIDTNLKGAFLCGQIAARAMVSAGTPGAIVNIASINAKIALAGQAHYTASKGGLVMLTKAMALDLAPHGIRVNAIGPGVIETRMTERSLSDPQRRAMLLSKVPLGRVGQPRDVAHAALFLASDEASYITGATLYVDGGWLAG